MIPPQAAAKLALKSNSISQQLVHHRDKKRKHDGRVTLLKAGALPEKMEGTRLDQIFFLVLLTLSYIYIYIPRAASHALKHRI